MYGHPVHNHHATKVSMLMSLLNLVFFIMQCYEMGFRLKTDELLFRILLRISIV